MLTYLKPARLTSCKLHSSNLACERLGCPIATRCSEEYLVGVLTKVSSHLLGTFTTSTLDTSVCSSGTPAHANQRCHHRVAPRTACVAHGRACPEYVVCTGTGTAQSPPTHLHTAHRGRARHWRVEVRRYAKGAPKCRLSTVGGCHAA